jgi:hypothetical protein
VRAGLAAGDDVLDAVFGEGSAPETRLTRRSAR